MPFPMMPGAPMPTQSLFGGANPLEMLQRMLASGGVQQQAPQPPAMPTQPARTAGPVDPIAAELDAQIRADPIAQQNMDNPNYEDMLKAELVKELQKDDNPGRAIQRALAAAGAAISGGQDVWQGISTGVNAYHGARDDRSGRIGALKALSDMDVAKANRPFEAEERAAELEAKRALAEERRSRAKYGPLERGQKEAERGLNTRIKIDDAVRKLRDSLADDYTIPEEEKAAAVERYRQELEEQAGDMLGTAPVPPPAGTPARSPTGMPQASPDIGGAPNQIFQHPETGQRVYWDGKAWVDLVTRQPVPFGG